KPGDTFSYQVKSGGKRVSFTPKDITIDQSIAVRIPEAKLWTPDSPHLYDLTDSLHQEGKVIDEVTSYFPVRTISAAKDDQGDKRNQFVGTNRREDATTFTAEEKKQFRDELKAMIDHLRSFACIVCWVPFNEGWGQHDTNEILKWVKQYDPSRLVDGPSGWTDRGYGD